MTVGPTLRAVTILGSAIGTVKLNQQYPMGVDLGLRRVEAGVLLVVGASVAAVGFRRAGMRATSSVCVDVAIGGVVGTLHTATERPLALLAPRESRAQLGAAKAAPATAPSRAPHSRRPRKRAPLARALVAELVELGGVAETEAQKLADRCLERLQAAGFGAMEPAAEPRAGWILERSVSKRIKPIFAWAIPSGATALARLVQRGWRFERRAKGTEIATPTPRSGLKRRDLSALAVSAPTPEMFPIPPGLPAPALDKGMGAKIRVG